jgi:hypothetical protein
VVAVCTGCKVDYDWAIVQERHVCFSHIVGNMKAYSKVYFVFPNCNWFLN